MGGDTANVGAITATRSMRASSCEAGCDQPPPDAVANGDLRRVKAEVDRPRLGVDRDVDVGVRLLEIGKVRHQALLWRLGTDRFISR
jgi:hypothetical protein